MTASVYESLRLRFQPENPLDLTGGGSPSPGKHDFIRLTMPPTFEEARRRLEEALTLGTPSCLWLLEKVLEPLVTGFRLLTWVHDERPEISYATAADEPGGWSLLWPSSPRRAVDRWVSEAERAAAEFSPSAAWLMVPVSAELAPALAGMSLSPRLYRDENHWLRLTAARDQFEERERFSAKLETMFHHNKPEQARAMDELAGRERKNSG